MSYANHPNAALIDEVLDHVRTHPQRWLDAYDATWCAARVSALDAAWSAAWGTTRDAARGATWDAVWSAAWYATRGAAGDTARNAACALIAFPEEAATLIRQEPDVVRMVASTGSHAAILLLPATIAMASKG